MAIVTATGCQGCRTNLNPNQEAETQSENKAVTKNMTVP